jgi:arylsulfatase A-like enzyme
LITVDTLRADHLSSYGYHLRTSPNMDQLAAEGVRFTNAHTVVPQTGPAHISLMTSRYPQEHGGRINGIAYTRDAKLIFLPQILKKFDYETAAFVSAWPLTERMCQLDDWFDVYDEELTRQYQMVNTMRWAEDVTPRAISWFTEEWDKEKPFFAWVHYFDPHTPYNYRPRFETLEQIRKPGRLAPGMKKKAARERVKQYNSEILYADYWIGKLLDEMERLGVEDDTLIVLTADHGESLGEHNYVGHGQQLYDPIVRIPMMMKLPGYTTPGKVIESEVSIIDIMPTVLDLTVRKVDPDLEIPFELAGRSLAKSINGGGEPDEQMVRFITFEGKKGFLPKFITDLFLNLDGPPLKMGHRIGVRKVIYTPEDEKLEIYNVKQDPLELKAAKPKGKSPQYKTETARLDRWYEATSGAAGENEMTEEDVKALKSLGYLQ